MNYKPCQYQKSEICLFNPFMSYIEYSLIYIYKHMGQGDICIKWPLPKWTMNPCQY